MTITVASGKGGTGKTTVAVNLSLVLSNTLRHRQSDSFDDVKLIDCDVEEPNTHLFVHPQFTSEYPVTIQKPRNSAESCTSCGACVDICKYHALAMVNGNIMFFPELCHGCGACVLVCRSAAMEETEHTVGMIRVSENTTPIVIQGESSIGETAAPRVVAAAKEHSSPEMINIIDAPPGTGCSVVEAVKDADAVLLVTEPTPFGLHDLNLVTQLARKLSVPAAIVINRSDGTDDLIVSFAEECGVPIVARIPCMRAYAEAYSKGHMLCEEFPELHDIFFALSANIDTMGARVPDSPIRRSSHAPCTSPQTARTDAKEIAIVSGKGGTGKTSIAASFCALAKAATIVDTDVDAANLSIICDGKRTCSGDFIGMAKAEISAASCDGCGRCAEACHFDAIIPAERGNDLTPVMYEVDPSSCEGCGVCAFVCPQNAVVFKEHVAGEWLISETPVGPMAHAQLGIAEDNSGKLVTKVRDLGHTLSANAGSRVIIGDGPPGIGCPAISSTTGTDLVIAVAEPTVSGVHDLKRLFLLLDGISVPSVVVINKADLNTYQTRLIEQEARRHGSRIVGYVPYDAAVTRAIVERKTVVSFTDSPAARAITAAWEAISEIIGT